MGFTQGNHSLKESALRDLRSFFRGAANVLYHIVVVTLSGGIALSLPLVAGFLAEDFMVYWNQVKSEEVVLVSIEIAVALFLILGFNYIGRSIRDRQIAKMAAGAGLVQFFSSRGRLARRRIKKAKAKQGMARSVMAIGSTGYRTFVDAEGDLHNVLEDCLEAKIMLLNPYSEAAQTRARAILHPDVTPLHLREQVERSLEFLKRLKAAHKNVKLKLYSDLPHIKLTILGDHIWMQHYHANLDVRTMPEYVFKHNQDNHSLYTLFYQYFMERWESPEIPEYDLETDELVYQGSGGSEVRREKFSVDFPRQAVQVGDNRDCEQEATRS